MESPPVYYYAPSVRRRAATLKINNGAGFYKLLKLFKTLSFSENKVLLRKLNTFF
jgi:hypothetical protein